MNHSESPITDQEFALFQRLIYKIAGISGDWPVLAMVRTWSTSGHVVLPLKWVDWGDHKEIWVADPSRPPTTTVGAPKPQDHATRASNPAKSAQTALKLEQAVSGERLAELGLVSLRECRHW